jgi:hypothetical protein
VFTQGGNKIQVTRELDSALGNWQLSVDLLDCDGR